MAERRRVSVHLRANNKLDDPLESNETSAMDAPASRLHDRVGSLHPDMTSTMSQRRNLISQERTGFSGTRSNATHRLKPPSFIGISDDYIPELDHTTPNVAYMCLQMKQ